MPKEARWGCIFLLPAQLSAAQPKTFPMSAIGFVTHSLSANVDKYELHVEVSDIEQLDMRNRLRGNRDIGRTYE